MGQDNEEAGQDTQKIHPETMWLPREFNDWLVFMVTWKKQSRVIANVPDNIPVSRKRSIIKWRKEAKSTQSLPRQQGKALRESLRFLQTSTPLPP